jgi:hypothetical protein
LTGGCALGALLAVIRYVASIFGFVAPGMRPGGGGVGGGPIASGGTVHEGTAVATPMRELL